MTESQLQSQITAYLKSQGIYYVKIILSTRNGSPDIIACHNGQFIAIEVKTKKGILSPLQAMTLKNIIASGGRAIVARSLEDVRRMIE